MVSFISENFVWLTGSLIIFFVLVLYFIRFPKQRLGRFLLILFGLSLALFPSYFLAPPKYNVVVFPNGEIFIDPLPTIIAVYFGAVILAYVVSHFAKRKHD